MWIFVPCTFRSSIAPLAGQNDVSFVRNFKKCEIDLNLNLKFEIEKNGKFRWYHTPSLVAFFVLRLWCMPTFVMNYEVILLTCCISNIYIIILVHIIILTYKVYSIILNFSCGVGISLQSFLVLSSCSIIVYLSIFISSCSHLLFHFYF